MASINISFHKINVYTVNENSRNKEIRNNCPMDKIGDSSIGEIIFSYLHNLAESYTDKNKDPINEKIIKVKSAQMVDYYIDDEYYYSGIEAIIKSGQFGVGKEITNISTGIFVTNQTTEQAGLMPFGFSIYYSQGISSGLLVTQSMGVNSASSTVVRCIKSAIKNINEKYVIEIVDVVPQKFFKELLSKNKIKNIYVEHYLNQSKKDLNDNDDNVPFDYSVKEVKYRNPIVKDYAKLYRAVVKRKLAEYIGITNGYDEVTNIKIDFKVGKKSKVINYNTFFNLKVSVDITNNVETESSTMWPVPNSLFHAIRDKALDYLILLDIVRQNDELEISNKLLKYFYVRINTTNNKEEVILKENDT